MKNKNLNVVAEFSVILNPNHANWISLNKKWCDTDFILKNEVLKICTNLNHEGRFKPDSKEYFDQIDLELYKKHKKRLLKYFSNGN